MVKCATLIQRRAAVANVSPVDSRTGGGVGDARWGLAFARMTDRETFGSAAAAGKLSSDSNPREGLFSALDSRHRTDR
jgi:hypothetical protein